MVSLGSDTNFVTATNLKKFEVPVMYSTTILESLLWYT
jgi:hypothetical protein